jgi:hypothetical protein
MACFRSETWTRELANEKQECHPLQHDIRRTAGYEHGERQSFYIIRLTLGKMQVNESAMDVLELSPKCHAIHAVFACSFLSQILQTDKMIYWMNHCRLSKNNDRNLFLVLRFRFGGGEISVAVGKKENTRFVRISTISPQPTKAITKHLSCFLTPLTDVELSGHCDRFFCQ